METTSAHELAAVNLEKAKAVAKDRVYPALVFVKPIQETFEGGERERMEVYGSGVIIDPNGLVVTNNHVAENAIEVNCVLGDREQVTATVVGLDPETDLALLRLELPDGHPPLPSATFADSSKVAEGQVAMALGSPFGFTRSISQGIVSNTKRYLGFSSQHRFNLWFQTDAAINPGNSGGPLVDIDGRIIGINTLGTWADGIGFAIPSNTVRDIVSRLRTRSGQVDEDDWPVKVQRAYTGLQLQALNDFNSNTFTDANTGVLVRSVDADSPARDAGVRDGDILLGVTVGDVYRPTDGVYVEDLPRIECFLADLPVGKEPPATTFLVARRQQAGEGTSEDRQDAGSAPLPRPVSAPPGVSPGDVNGREFLAIEAQPVIRGKFEGEDLDLKRWNMTVKEISKYTNPTLDFLHPEGGVFIQGVRYPGNASDADLRTNDILLKIGDEPIKTLADVKRVYDELVENEDLAEKKVLIVIKRSGRPNWKILDWSKDYLKEE
jgi:serine protease Do